jgi:hypothetical protein
MNPLYEALVERDVPRARAAAVGLHGDELFLSVARFAVLAYAPSQHAKHALLACLAAREAGATDEMLVECAIYAAASRQPWSEPPILEPPAEDDSGEEGFDDRAAAERWLARRWQRNDFAHLYFREAGHDFEDLGHSLIVSAAAWKLAALLGEQGRYAVLRVGVWEMASHRAVLVQERGEALDLEALAARVVDACVAASGEIVSAHSVFLLDAAIECGDDEVLRRVRDYLTAVTPAVERQPSAPMPELTVYDLARDYAATLKAHAVAKRWQTRFPSLDLAPFVAAIDWNRLHGPSFEEWSFA